MGLQMPAVSRRMFARSLLAVPALAPVALGCGPVHGTVTRTVDGRTVTEEVEYANYREFFKSVGRELVNPWVQIGKALAAAMKELRRIIKEMIDSILHVPAPGTIALADLDPAFASFAGGRHDYVGTDQFTYVRLDVPAFDAFFEASMGLFAYTTQLVRSTNALRDEIGLRKGYQAAAKMSVRDLLALGAEAPSTRDLTTVVEATLGPSSSYRDKVRELRATGTNLVTNAKRTLLDPRVVVHVDLVVEGVAQSLEVLAETAKLFVELFKHRPEREVARN